MYKWSHFDPYFESSWETGLNDKYVLILRAPDTNRKSNSYLGLTSM